MKHFRRSRSGVIAAIALSAAACAVTGCAAARPLPPGEIARPVPAPAEARPALWKVADADTTIYLFGTVHALPPGITWFDGPIATAFDASGELVTEITEGDPAQLQGIILSRAVLPEGQTLRGMLSPDDRAALEKALLGYGLPLDALDRFEPWMAAVSLSTLPLARAGYGAQSGVEAALAARVKILGHPHTALETADFQIGLFDALPLDLQKKYLREVADHLPEFSEQIAAIVREWRAGDADKLAQLMNDDQDDPALLQALLYSRNQTWAGWVKQRLDRPGTVFVAVGAGHLAGPGSVQDKLKTLGIATTRVQ